MRPPSAARREDGVGHLARGYQGPAVTMIGHPSRARRYVRVVPEHALKEWAVTIAALAAGDQVLIVRKGGIGEKRFELPHPRFYLFPTYAHQRPELVKPAARERFADPLAQREEPARLPLPAYAELHVGPPDRATRRRSPRSTPSTSSRPTTRPSACAGGAAPAVGGRAAGLARARAAGAARSAPEHGGCVSWVDLPEDDRRPRRRRARRSPTRTFAARRRRRRVGARGRRGRRG